MSTYLSESELRSFATTLLQRWGAGPAQATITAVVLCGTDAMGRSNQGVWRLPMICARLRDGGFDAFSEPKVEKLKPNLARLDGSAGIGHFVAHRAAELVGDLADEHGIAAVSVRNSNHLGAAGFYAAMLAARGHIGIVTSNAFPKVLASGGATPVLGTNPLAVGVPRSSGNPILLDMSTSAVAGSTITKALETSKELPEGVAVSATGTDTSNPADARGLLPFGGAKGYGLSLIVEILSGVLSGAAISHQLGSAVTETSRSSGNGHMLLAFKVATFMSEQEFSDRVSLLVNFVSDSGEHARMPGDARGIAREASSRDGVFLDDATCEALSALALDKGMAVPW